MSIPQRRPTRISRPEDLNPRNVENMMKHFDRQIKSKDLKIIQLEQAIASLTDRIAALETT
jgi:hypothetical protein